MKNNLQILFHDKKAGAETIVYDLIHADELKKNNNFKVFLLSRFWSNQSETFPEHTVSLFTVIKTKWEVVHSHLFWGGLFVALFQRALKFNRWIHSVHYADYAGQKFSGLRKKIDQKIVFVGADNLHLVSDAARKIIPVGVPFDVIRNSYFKKNEEAVFPVVSELKIAGKLKILTVSQHRTEKNLNSIIEVAQLLKQKNLNFEWTLCGDGPLYEEFLSKVKNRSLEDVINCVGFQKNLKPFYFQADLYVQPSLTESFGLTVIDGIKAQKPVLLSNVEAFHKIIDKNLYKDNFIDLGPHFIKELSDRILKFNNDQLFRNTIFNATIAACREIQKFSYNDWINEWHLFIDRKKILFISPITTEATGGLQKQLYLQSTKLKSMNYDIYLLQRQDNINGKEIFSSQKWSHIRFIQTPHLNFISNWKWGQKINSLLFLTFGILKVSRFRHFDVVHAQQMYSPTIIGVVAKKLFKCRLVVKVTASGVLGEVAQLRNMDFLKLRKLCFTYVDKFLTLTSSMRDELIEFGINSNQVEVVPNSVEIFDAVEYKGHRKINILYSGRISTEKSIETLICASQKLATRLDQHEIILNIAGRVYSDRNNYRELLDLSEQNPKNMTINFLGHVSDMSYLYKAADVFVLPSLSEGMSNSLLEAMSYGLPCVVSSISANTALISDQKNGLVFETAKEQQLYIKLMHLFGDSGEGLQRRQKLGQEARKFIQENFSVENICKKIETQYDLQ